ncbi:MAG: HD domain-containing protein [Chloroflexota bacterium]|nr:HD domain-containing protein [Chloroflexota bacterium]
MTQPSHEEAAAILVALQPPPWFARHSSAVADVAAFLAARLEESGHPIDRPLAEVAALLHDVDKVLPAADPLRDALGHGAAGAAWLAARGHPELASAVANHPASRLSDDAHYSQWKASATIEERVVAYADKRATQELVTLDERFDEWLARHPEQAGPINLGRQRARELEESLCHLAGIGAADVARLAWAEAAISRAAMSAAGGR